MHTLTWILGSALAMSAIAWIGLVTAALKEEQLQRLLLPLVAFAAGSLLGGALLHLLPEAVAASGPGVGTFLPALGGFALFFLMEQFLSWHHGHSIDPGAKQPVTYLILLADAAGVLLVGGFRHHFSAVFCRGQLPVHRRVRLDTGSQA